MMTGDQIPELVNLLKKRRTCLYHACQYQDFITYLEIGGIASRQLLEASNHRFTPFETDEVDHNNGVWDKTFVNLSDFGCIFANGSWATPNPYGPIQLYIQPTALLEASDIAICLRSAGGREFNRECESLSSIKMIDQLFTYHCDVGFPYSDEIKPPWQLKRDFKNPQAKSPEVSCSFPHRPIPIEFVSLIVTDPYRFNGRSLTDIINAQLSNFEKKIPIKIRMCGDKSRPGLYDELLVILQQRIPTLDQLCNDRQATRELLEWAHKLNVNSLEYQFHRYASYLRQGTILPILSQSG